MQQQETVAEFVDEHDIDAPPAYRLLDLAAEVGEVANDAAESSDYGESPATLEISSDEIGDALFSLLALANTVDVDADAALRESLDKYEERLADYGSAGSSP